MIYTIWLSFNTQIINSGSNRITFIRSAQERQLCTNKSGSTIIALLCIKEWNDNRYKHVIWHQQLPIKPSILWKLYFSPSCFSNGVDSKYYTVDLFVFKLSYIKTIHFKTFIIMRTTETLIIGFVEVLKFVIYGNHYLGNTHIQLPARAVSVTCGLICCDSYVIWV